MRYSGAPEDVIIGGEGAPATVESVLFEGERYAVKLTLGNGQTLRAFSRVVVEAGETVRVVIPRRLAAFGRRASHWGGKTGGCPQFSWSRHLFLRQLPDKVRSATGLLPCRFASPPSMSKIS